MTKNSPCRYGDDRDRAIVDYLYGECDPGARTAFELHLVECSQCAGEVSAFRGVRQVLAGWAPPEPMRALDHSRATTNPVATGPRLATVTSPADRADADVSGPPRELPRGFAAWPVWAQAAAAVLCVGVGLGSANLRISYSAAGLSVGTGWLESTAPAAMASPAAAPVTASADARPWQADLTALAEQLREDMRVNAGHVTAATGPVAQADEAARDAALIRQVRTLIQRSEERQQQEMAVRVSTMLTDLQNQRRSDLARIERTIGVVQNNTGMEVLRQQQLINSLAVRVSSQR